MQNQAEKIGEYLIEMQKGFGKDKMTMTDYEHAFSPGLLAFPPNLSKENKDLTLKILSLRDEAEVAYLQGAVKSGYKFENMVEEDKNKITESERYKSLGDICEISDGFKFYKERPISEVWIDEKRNFIEKDKAEEKIIVISNADKTAFHVQGKELIIDRPEYRNIAHGYKWMEDLKMDFFRCVYTELGKGKCPLSKAEVKKVLKNKPPSELMFGSLFQLIDTLPAYLDLIAKGKEHEQAISEAKEQYIKNISQKLGEEAWQVFRNICGKERPKKENYNRDMLKKLEEEYLVLTGESSIFPQKYFFE